MAQSLLKRLNIEIKLSKEEEIRFVSQCISTEKENYNNMHSGIKFRTGCILVNFGIKLNNVRYFVNLHWRGVDWGNGYNIDENDKKKWLSRLCSGWGQRGGGAI